MRRLGALAGWSAAAVTAATAWWARGEAEAARAAQDAAELEARRAREERERLREEVARRDEALARRSELVERLQRSRKAEREFSQELRAQLHRSYQARGELAEGDGGDDARELVLRAAIELTGAEKGLLLSREDADNDGDLDVVASRGFEHDPTHSAVAQRFAHHVLERDTTVREDEPDPEAEGRTEADGEIENLVAVPLYMMDRFQGVVICANRPGGFEELDDDLLLAVGDQAGEALHTQRLQNEINDAHRAALRILADALEAADPVLRRQAGEASMLARALCRRLELAEREHEVVASAAMVRDVGHLGVPERILRKPGPLSPEERSVVELHPRTGFSLISQLPALRDVAEAVLYHHERYDGSGYPGGLSGDVIPLPARVLAVVDAYSAMVHDRPYRPPRSSEEALQELEAGAGSQFDPEIVGLFCDEVRRTRPAMDTGLADAVASALDSAGGVGPIRPDAPAPDALTLLAGHRDFREAAQLAGEAASADGPAFTVAIVQLEDLEEVNAREGYRAGDHVIQAAARAAQRAAQRLGGTVYRDSGRRFAVLVPAPDGTAAPDVAAELHTEFAVGPGVRLGVAPWQPGDSGEDVVRRARAALLATALPPSEPNSR
jgi:HD-GYP domain-containing protein (c-di-GMP phosphodiesterase class II)/GGDEF domain-containing protein